MTREEAIKLVKRIKGAMVYTEEEKEAIETLIPELRESDSEDEKFQKYILKVCKECVEANDKGLELSMSTTKKLLAYLEKQKDASKAIEAVDRIDKYIDENVANAHDMKDSNPDKKYYCGWDAALGKMAGILQDVYSGSNQKEEEGYVAIPVESTLEYKLGFKAGKESEKQKEQKQWSEEDERMLSRCIKSVECSKQFADSESYKAAKDVEMNWLKSLPERFLLQSKQEWSEEDEEALDMCLEVIPKKWKTKSGILLTKWLKDNIHLQSEQEWSEEVKKKISKLKTFIGQNWFHKENQNKAFDMIDSLLPKPHGIQSEKKRHWKPSEKQLIALRYYLNHVPYSTHKEHLSSLRDDCEKLFFQ